MKRQTTPEAKAAMLADYAAGMSSSAVARKHGASPDTVLRFAREAGITRTLAEARFLAKARREWEAARAYDAEYGLTGGRWVLDPRTRVQRWVAA